MIIGAALTKFDPGHAGSGYSSYYGYDYYRYGDEQAAARA